MLVHLRSSSEVVEPGSYAFAIYAWRYTGPRAKTQIVCFSESDEVAEDISGLIRSGSTDSARLVVHDSRWHALDAVHVERWGVAKERYVESVRERGRYRIQCLENGLRLKKRSLSRDDENTDARILRMHESELRSAERECARRIAEIQAGVGTADIHTVLLARGVVEVSRGGCNV